MLLLTLAACLFSQEPPRHAPDAADPAATTPAEAKVAQPPAGQAASPPPPTSPEAAARLAEPPPAEPRAAHPPTETRSAPHGDRLARANRSLAAGRAADGSSAGFLAEGDTYEHPGLGGYVAAERDPVSTFSVDVDTASYAIARRHISRRQLPPPASVRVEEFVNAFAYDDPAPRDGSPFAIHLDGAPHPWIAGHHVIRVGVVAARIPSGRRAPLHLTFLVDTSGSMQGDDRLGLARKGLHLLVDNLEPGDTVAIATYAGSVRKVLDPTPAERAARIHAAIDSLSAGGSTAMASGLELAYEMASAAFVPGEENRVIVMSDGDANVGPTSAEAMLERIGRHAARGITLSVLGFGSGNYRDARMERLADRGNGNYTYVDSLAQARRVFGRDLAANLHVLARDVKVQVAFDPEQVRTWRLVGYENRALADAAFRDDAVDAGEVGPGHRVTALYDVVLAGDPAPGVPLAEVRLRARPPHDPRAPAREWRRSLLAGDLASRPEAASRSLRLALGAATFAEMLRASPYRGTATYREVWRFLRATVDPEREDEAELLDLVAAAGALSGEPRPVAWR